MVENIRVGDGEFAVRGGPEAIVEFVCLVKHKTDSTNPAGYSVVTHGQLSGYCARGADQNHEWIRVPPTPLDQITIGKMEDRPPEPVRRRASWASRTI